MQNSVNTWTDVWELFRAWWNGDVPLGGVMLSIIITILRVAYTGGGRKQMLLEGRYVAHSPLPPPKQWTISTGRKR
ncbi:phage holin family protein [Candidatus Symbiopectobacterium endolongispinus]|uniref:phage holin family protein n=1 Tax=Candidatus Symbiopectobacterium endolongispinus TaxID=2812664 RepID=UPI003F688393